MNFFGRANGSLERSHSKQSITRDGICREGIRSPCASDNKTNRRDPAGGKYRVDDFQDHSWDSIAAVSIASPALAQHASEKGHLMSVRHTGHVRAVTHLSALRSFASITRGLDDPASTGGGSMGYNASLRLNHW